MHNFLATESDGTSGIIAPDDVTNGACKRAMKGMLVLPFSVSYQFMRFQGDKLKQLKAELSSTKSQLIEKQ